MRFQTKQTIRALIKIADGPLTPDVAEALTMAMESKDRRVSAAAVIMILDLTLGEGIDPKKFDLFLEDEADAQPARH